MVAWPLPLRAWRAWRERKRRQQAAQLRRRAAEQRAVEAFQAAYPLFPVAGAVVLAEHDGETLVRVMYMVRWLPPERAWYAVSADLAAARRLAFEDVAPWETTAWR